MGTSFLFDKQRAVHLRVAEDINRRHPHRFKTHGPAAIGIFDFMGDEEMLAEKAVNERTFVLLIVRHSIASSLRFIDCGLSGFLLFATV